MFILLGGWLFGISVLCLLVVSLELPVLCYLSVVVILVVPEPKGCGAFAIRVLVYLGRKWQLSVAWLGCFVRCHLLCFMPALVEIALLIC